MAIGALAAVWAVQTGIALVRPRGDFLLHYEFGRRLWFGESLYADGLHRPYPPSWAVPFAFLSRVPPNLAKALLHVAGALALRTLFMVLRDLSRSSQPVPRTRELWVDLAALAVAGRVVLRDFDDGGPNLVVLAACWSGIWLAARGRTALAGAGLGLAIGLKCTTAIFIPYFLLKRQWTLALASVGWAAVVLLSPMPWMGMGEYRRAMECWAGAVATRVYEPDPSVGVLGPEKLQNWSLRNSLARYLLRLPADHPGRAYLDDAPDGSAGRVVNPGYVELLDLPPAVAGSIIDLVLLASGLAVAWRMRGGLVAGGQARYLAELAAVGVLALLFSPITWSQHCVAVLPAVYLLTRNQAAAPPGARAMPMFLVGFGLLFVLSSRAFLGKPTSLLIESYHVHTMALVALVVALLAVRPSSR